MRAARVTRHSCRAPPRASVRVARPNRSRCSPIHRPTLALQAHPSCPLKSPSALLLRRTRTRSLLSEHTPRTMTVLRLQCKCTTHARSALQAARSPYPLSHSSAISLWLRDHLAVLCRSPPPHPIASTHARVLTAAHAMRCCAASEQYSGSVPCAALAQPYHTQLPYCTQRHTPRAIALRPLTGRAWPLAARLCQRTAPALQHAQSQET